jgi:hypothetical protein
LVTDHSLGVRGWPTTPSKSKTVIDPFLKSWLFNYLFLFIQFFFLIIYLLLMRINLGYSLRKNGLNFTNCRSMQFGSIAYPRNYPGIIGDCLSVCIIMAAFPTTKGLFNFQSSFLTVTYITQYAGRCFKHSNAYYCMSCFCLNSKWVSLSIVEQKKYDSIMKRKW